MRLVHVSSTLVSFWSCRRQLRGTACYEVILSASGKLLFGGCFEMECTNFLGDLALYSDLSVIVIREEFASQELNS